MSDFAPAAEVATTRAALERLKANMRVTIKGKDDVIEQTLVCLLASGHLLIEDLPGVGKTTLAHVLARSLGLNFQRIQFTSDLLPTDVTGVSIYDEAVKEFVFKPGPVFASVVLADEINRATPKTQSALLEVMDRSKVTVDGEAHSVGAPFMVVATQNPVDYEGTFPLPESQMDRFLMRLQMGYPQPGDELEILRTPRLGYDAIALNPVVTRSEVIKMQALVGKVFVEDSVLDYILKISTVRRSSSASDVCRASERRWASTAPAIACTSSGMTKSRPSISDRACAATRSASPPRTLTPALNSTSVRVAVMIFRI